jgi:hypothetical protein
MSVFDFYEYFDIWFIHKYFYIVYATTKKYMYMYIS